jgi:hypothetical protein
MQCYIEQMQKFRTANSSFKKLKVQWLKNRLFSMLWPNFKPQYRELKNESSYYLPDWFNMHRFLKTLKR